MHKYLYVHKLMLTYVRCVRYSHIVACPLHLLPPPPLLPFPLPSLFPSFLHLSTLCTDAHRRKVYEILTHHGVEVPKYAVATHTKDGNIFSMCSVYMSMYVWCMCMCMCVCVCVCVCVCQWYMCVMYLRTYAHVLFVHIYYILRVQMDSVILMQK